MLTVNDLSVSFGKKGVATEVIHGVSFSVPPNSIVGIVGESGSGKSVTALAIMGLLPNRSSFIEGEILFESKNLIGEKVKAMQLLRGNEIAMIFQEPMSA